MLPSQSIFLRKLSLKKAKTRRLLSPFGLALLLVVLLGTLAPLQSQTTAPLLLRDCVVPPALCTEIKQLAQDDVIDDIPRRTSHAIELFKEKHLAWKTDPAKAKVEVSRTYDREYSQREKAKNQDPRAIWEKWVGNGLSAPFLGVILLIVGAWFREAIGKAWLALVQKVDNWVYSRFAGTILFESVALQRYREALIENYQHLKIPLGENQKLLEMGKIYVPLKMSGASDSDQVDAYGAIAQYRRLMITGSPGAGKTMLLRHIAFTYGKGHLPGLKNRPIPVLVELHRLSDPNLTEEKLIAEIVATFRRNRFPNAERFVCHSLQQGKLMLLLDGLDEVNSKVRPVLAQHLGDLLRSTDERQRCRLITTCRTEIYDNEFAYEADQTLEVMEFTDQQMRRFLEAWRLEIPEGKSIDQLMLTLRDRPRIMTLARNPLLLTIIAYLYADPSFELPRSRTEFYQESTHILLKKWQNQKKLTKYLGSDKQRVLQHLALYQQQASMQKQHDRRSIDYPVVLEQIRPLLRSLNLNPENDASPFLEELVERSGLFLKVDGGDRYQFAHLTLQEYFAAVALADKPHDLMQFFRQDPDTWREVVKLWCGLAGDSTTLIMDIYQQDAILGFECLADAQEVDLKQAETIIEHCKRLLVTTSEPDNLIKAFGAVAASDRPRGQAVFHFLETALGQSNCYFDEAIAQALSFTNRPQAAEVLAAQYVAMDDLVRQPLLRMGDLAVPELAQLVNSHLSALKDLHAIGTPDAAVALVPMLWQGLFTSPVAWYLASLLQQPGVEEALKAYDFSRLGQNKTLEPREAEKALAWVWQPFQDSPNSAMASIMKKIVYGIASDIDMNANTIPYDLPLTFGLELVIPIIAIQCGRRCTYFVVDIKSLPPYLWGQIDRLMGLDPTDQLEKQITEIVNTFFTQSDADNGWRYLLNGLQPQLQLELLQRLVIASRSPQKEDWINFFRTVKYKFKTSRHYRAVLLIAALLTLVAGVGLWHMASVQFTGVVIGIVGFVVVVVGVFWITLTTGIEEPWEPSLFIKLGVLGLQTYTFELNRTFQSHIFWVGIEVLSKLIDAGASAVTAAFTKTIAAAVAGAIASALAAMLALTISAAGYSATAGAIAFAIAMAFAGAMAGTSATVARGAATTAITLAIAVIVAGSAVSSNTFSIALGGASVAYGIGIIAGLGLGSWYRLEDEPESLWRKPMAVLALPWFCTAPIVLYFTWVGLTTLFAPLTFAPLPPWQFAGLLELVLIGMCCWLWRRGQKLEAMARNPLQGGLIEANLRQKYGYL
jgi:hypothetical protein